MRFSFKTKEKDASIWHVFQMLLSALAVFEVNVLIPIRTAKHLLKRS